MERLKERYTNALLEPSKEKGTLEEDLEQVILLREALKSEEAQEFLTHPHVMNQAKYELFQDTFSKNISDHLMEFLYLMVRENRESLIVPVLTEYIEHIKKRLGKIEAKIVSAKVLTEKQIESIRKVLSEKMNMQIEIKTVVDPDMIAGFYVLINGRIFDGTLRSELNNMRERLKRGNYEC